jgi:hypothetical protein
MYDPPRILDQKVHAHLEKEYGITGLRVRHIEIELTKAKIYDEKRMEMAAVISYFLDKGISKFGLYLYLRKRGFYFSEFEFNKVNKFVDAAKAKYSETEILELMNDYVGFYRLEDEHYEASQDPKVEEQLRNFIYYMIMNGSTVEEIMEYFKSKGYPINVSRITSIFRALKKSNPEEYLPTMNKNLKTRKLAPVVPGPLEDSESLKTYFEEESEEPLEDSER